MRCIARGKGRFPYTVSGLVTVRQRPGSAKGVMFITLEDETDIANLIIWPSLFDKQRRVILGAQMLACRGKVQAANGVIHVVAEHLIDHSDLLRKIGGSNEAFVIPAGRGMRPFMAAEPVSTAATVWRSSMPRGTYTSRTFTSIRQYKGAEFLLRPAGDGPHAGFTR
jgi:hypothetical protein